MCVSPVHPTCLNFSLGLRITRLVVVRAFCSPACRTVKGHDTRLPPAPRLGLAASSVGTFLCSLRRTPRSTVWKARWRGAALSLKTFRQSSVLVRSPATGYEAVSSERVYSTLITAPQLPPSVLPSQAEALK